MRCLGRIKFISVLSLMVFTTACAPHSDFTRPVILAKKSILAQSGAVASPADFKIPESDEPVIVPKSIPIPPIPETDPKPTINPIPETDPKQTTNPVPKTDTTQTTNPVPKTDTTQTTNPVPKVEPKKDVGISVPIENICSNRVTNAAGTNLTRSSGVVAKVYALVGKKYRRITQAEVSPSQLRQTLIDERKLNVDLSAQPAGKYAVILCSSDDFSGKCDWEGKADGLSGSKTPPRLLLGDVTGNGAYILTKKGNGTVTKAIGHEKMAVIYKDNPNNLSTMHRGKVPGCDKTYSPLVIDTLNPIKSGGVQLTAPSKGIRFDMQGNGMKRQISWFAQPEKDCLLALPDAGGKIKNIQELFGNNTVGPDGRKASNGFTALAKYDSNRDEVIDSKDLIFKSLRLWCDAVKSDGIVDEGEIFTLEQKSLEAISLRYISSDDEDEDIYGNQALQRSSVLGNEGERMIFDIWFRPID